MTSLRTLAAAFVVSTGCLSMIGILASALLVEAIVEWAATPLTFPVELGAALSELPLRAMPSEAPGG